MKLLNPLRRNRCHLCCVDFFLIALLFYCFPQYRGIFHIFCLLLSPVNTCCCSCGRCFLFLLYGLFRRTDEYRTLCLCSPCRFNGLVLLVIGGRSNACCAVLTGLQYSVLPLNGCAASFTCAGHFLAFMSCSLYYLPVWRFMSFLLAMQR